jgi:uncharacterized RDD family membrane protein YckC
MDDRYTIDTPENIEFAYDIAGLGSRLVAALVDTALIALILAFIYFFATLINDSLDLSDSLVAAGAAITSFLILWGYYILFEMIWSGQSPGKRLIGLRVVREGGRPITFTGSAIRNLVRLIDFLPFFYGIGVVVMFIDGRARRLGDLAAGVLVVRERDEVTLESLVRAAALPAAVVDPQFEPIGGIDRLLAEEYALIQDFLARRSELGRTTRARLGEQIALGLEQRLGQSAGADRERFLEQIAAAYRQHHSEAASAQ